MQNRGIFERNNTMGKSNHTTKMLAYLKREPKARERRFKDRAIVNLLSKQYGWLMRLIAETPAIKESVVRLVQDYASYDRAWRKLLADEENKHLRGSDYGDKVKYEQEKLVELGYDAPMSNEEWKSLEQTLEKQNS